MRRESAKTRQAWTQFILGKDSVKKAAKYGNEKVIDAFGRKFDSKREAKRAAELELLQKMGKISDLQYQVRFEIIPTQKGERACFWIADFTYIEDGKFVVEDAKGKRTRDYILKRKLMLKVHGITIQEV